MGILSYGYRNLRDIGHLRLVVWFFGNPLAVFNQAFDHHLDYFLNISHRLLGSLPPSCSTLLDESGTVDMPASSSASMTTLKV